MAASAAFRLDPIRRRRAFLPKRASDARCESACHSGAVSQIPPAVFEDDGERVANPIGDGAAPHAPTMDGGGRKRLAARVAKPMRKRRLPALAKQQFSDEAQKAWREQRLPAA
ncbi:MAG: hypothetical protein ABSA66_04380 [Roseiarcus sp.]